jgi:hypothetical protein
MLYSKKEGLTAMIRQLNPRIHIEGKFCINIISSQTNSSKGNKFVYDTLRSHLNKIIMIRNAEIKSLEPLTGSHEIHDDISVRMLRLSTN